MRYYQHHIGDYRKRTSHLNLLEHGIYRQLLDWYYLDESPLPSNINKIRRHVSARRGDEEVALDNVLSDFFHIEDEGYVHNRCETELKKIYDKSDKARKSAEARWNKPNGKRRKSMRTACAEDPIVLDSDANALDLHAKALDSNATHYPLPTTQSKTIVEQARHIIDLLNEITGKSFRYTDSHLSKIKSRLREGYSIADFKSVITVKNKQWSNDESNRMYLRPETLFSPKFDGYLQESKLKPISQHRELEEL